MSTCSISRILTAILLISAAVLFADDKPQGKATPMTTQTRMQVIRALQSELVYAHHAFPMGDKGLTLKDGTFLPSETDVQTIIASYGAAVKPGDPARITAVLFNKDNIVFEVNGGPKKKPKWYQRIEVGGMGGTTPISQPPDQNPNLHGSYLRLAFDKFVPEMTLDQLKQLLRPALNFDAKSKEEAYLESVPPKVKDAIKTHQVLVGMNREMVTYAKGRAPKKIRERDGATEYEEWIYGEPPQEVTFVRFVGDEVTRLEIMKVGGDKIVRTEKEVELGPPKPSLAEAQTADGQDQQQAPAKKPSLRRPGEPAPVPAPPGTNRPAPTPGQIPPPNPLPPSNPPPNSGPPPQ